MLMFLEGETQERLAILAKDRAATFRARGYAATNSKGQQFFEPSRCVFLHRLPPARSKAVGQDLEAPARGGADRAPLLAGAGVGDDEFRREVESLRAQPHPRMSSSTSQPRPRRRR